MKEEERINKITKPLIQWFKEEGRLLPWRKDQIPYHIWISEIMLQQTKIEAVKKYYTRFMEALPTISSLANIEEEKLLKLWEGLGYYSRARNLKKAAQKIQEEYNMQMPNSYEKLLTLPGIGEYTAGAIASIAFGEKVPAVDGNVLRVLSRIIENREDVLLPATKKEITKLLQQNMPEEPGVFNEAMMELGELICIPNGMPLCNKCPVQKNCLAYQHQTMLEIPKREKKLKRKQQQITVLLLHHHDKIAIIKRGNTGLLANMYEFPNVSEKLTKAGVQEWLERNALTANRIEKGGTHKHVFTHVEWHMNAYHVEVQEEIAPFIWDTKDNILLQYPIPTAFLTYKKEI